MNWVNRALAFILLYSVSAHYTGEFGNPQTGALFDTWCPITLKPCASMFWQYHTSRAFRLTLEHKEGPRLLHFEKRTSMFKGHYNGISRGKAKICARSIVQTRLTQESTDRIITPRKILKFGDCSYHEKRIRAEVYGKRKSPKSDKPGFSQKNRVFLKNSVFLVKNSVFLKN